MNFTSLIEEVKAARCAGFRYEQVGHRQFRDRVTVYRDGRLLFERFCYGEAAGLVYKLWAPRADETGAPQWDFSRCNVTGAREAAPKMLTGAGQGGLVFDGKPAHWACVAKLRQDKQNGYGGLLNMLKGLLPAKR